MRFCLSGHSIAPRGKAQIKKEGTSWCFEHEVGEGEGRACVSRFFGVYSGFGMCIRIFVNNFRCGFALRKDFILWDHDMISQTMVMTLTDLAK